MKILNSFEHIKFERLLLMIVFLFAFHSFVYCFDTIDTTGQKKKKADTTEKSSFESIISRFYKYPSFIENQATIELTYGSSNLGLPRPYNSVYAQNYNLGLKYGFTRIVPEFIVPKRSYFASEFVFAENVSSHLKPSEIITKDLTTDRWDFGCGYRNGFGYIFDNDVNLAFYHSSSFDWSKTVFEISPADDAEKEFIRGIDNKFLFGNSFEGSVRYEVFDKTYIFISYEKSLAYPSFDFIQWSTSSMIELSLQRTLDYFSEEFLKSNPDVFPIANFVVKNGISYLIYGLKENYQFWPWKSDRPIINQNFKIGVSFLF